jgi:hypothetical protein
MSYHYELWCSDFANAYCIYLDNKISQSKREREEKKINEKNRKKNVMKRILKFIKKHFGFQTESHTGFNFRKI